jgi:phosphatidylglycerophosphatase A
MTAAGVPSGDGQRGGAPPASPADRVAHVLAVWFGCGHVPFAPGTAGTLGAVPLYLLLRPLGAAAVALAAALVTGVGIWAAGRVVRRRGLPDPQLVCIDEVAGVLVTFVAAPATTAGLIAGFVVFRLFDHTKPWPARAAERRLRGGAAVVLDDIAAGAWGAVFLLAARALDLL